MSSVSRWNFQPSVLSMTWRLKRKPVPEMAQLVPMSIRELFRYRDSRMNHRAYPAEIQLSP